MKSTFKTFLSYLLCDWVATAGAILTSTTALLFLLYAFEAFNNPYYGIIVFLIIPGLFLLGLTLIPLGIWRCSRRVGGFSNIAELEVSGGRAVRLFGIVALLTIVNVTILSAAT